MRDVQLGELAIAVSSQRSAVEASLVHLLEEAVSNESPASRLKFGVAMGAAAVLRDSTVFEALVADAHHAGIHDAVEPAVAAAAEYAADHSLHATDDDAARMVETIRLALMYAFQKDRGSSSPSANPDSTLARCAKVARLIHALCIVRATKRDNDFTRQKETDPAPSDSRRSTLPGIQAAAPLSERVPMSEPQPSLARLHDSGTHLMLRVLVVSPDGTTRRALTRLIAPFEVVDVDGAAATLGLLKSYRAFDVLLIDASHDDSAANDLAQTIRATWPSVGDRIFFVRRNVAVPIDDPNAKIPLVRGELIEAMTSVRRRTLAAASR